MSYDVIINKNTVTKSFFWKMFERFMSQGINLVVQIVLARIILPEHFGSLAIIVALTNYANIFVQSGISTVIVQKKDLDKGDVSTLLTFSLVVAAFFYSVLFVGAPFLASYYHSDILSPALRVISLTLFLNSISAVQTGLLTRQMRFRTIFLRTIIAVPVSGIVGIIMALKGFGLWALIAYSMTNIICIVGFMSLDKQLRIPLGFNMSKMKSMFGFTSKILLTGLISGGHDFIRTMLIGKKYSKENLAYYDKGYSYSNLVTLVVKQSLGSVLLPAFSREQDNSIKLKSMARRTVGLSNFIMMPVLVAVAMMSKPLILLLLTDKWLASVPFLTIFCFLRIPGNIVTVDNQVYYALGKSGINLVYESCLFVVNVTVLLFTVRIGILAIAIGALLVEMLGLLAVCIISNKVYDYTLGNRLSDLWKATVSSFVMAMAIHGVSFLDIGLFPMLLIQIVLAPCVYFLMCRVVKDDNLQYCHSLVKDILRKK